MDWLDLLAIQGTLKSLLQHHSLKASILRCSAFFMVHLSHPWVTPAPLKMTPPPGTKTLLFWPHCLCCPPASSCPFCIHNLDPPRLPTWGLSHTPLSRPSLKHPHASPCSGLKAVQISTLGVTSSGILWKSGLFPVKQVTLKMTILNALNFQVILSMLLLLSFWDYSHLKFLRDRYPPSCGQLFPKPCLMTAHW